MKSRNSMIKCTTRSNSSGDAERKVSSISSLSFRKMTTATRASSEMCFISKMVSRATSAMLPFSK